MAMQPVDRDRWSSETHVLCADEAVVVTRVDASCACGSSAVMPLTMRAQMSGIGIGIRSNRTDSWSPEALSEMRCESRLTRPLSRT